MERLSDLPCRRRKTRDWIRTEIREPKNNQILVVRHYDDIVAYPLDVAAAGHPEGEQTADGVLLAHLHDRTVVIFLELKSTLKPRRDGASRLDNAFDQLYASISHFHPTGRSGNGQASSSTHGDVHHTAFSTGKDPIVVLPDINHDVVAVVVTFKQVPRDAPLPPMILGGKTVVRAAVQVSPADRNRAEIDLEKLLRQTGVERHLHMVPEEGSTRATEARHTT